jgi:ABC-type branched-subunit amino acid transport system substrate-binding protein
MPMNARSFQRRPSESGKRRPSRAAGVVRRAVPGAPAWVAVLFLLVGGCTLVGETPAPAPGAAPVVLEGPALEPGASDPARDRAAAELLAEGEARLAAGDLAGARALAREVETRYPAARGSSGALWLLARTELAAEAWEAAEGAAARYVEVAGVESATGGEAQVLLARARFRSGRDGAIEALFRLPGRATDPARTEGAALARSLAADLDDPSLRALMDEAPRHPFLLPVFQVELAERRFLVGDAAGARGHAEAALLLEPVAEDRERARQVLAGEVTRPETPEGRVAGVLGAVLALEGSPGLQQLSREIRDGIEVALLDERFRGGVQLRVAEDGGSPSRSGAALQGLSDANPLAVIGPLVDPAVAEAARARGRTLPMVSPTARSLPGGLEDVYALAGADPEASRVLAELAWNEGMRELVVFHRSAPEEESEFRWFREAFEARGGRILRSWSYGPGSTAFPDQLQAIARLQPRGLVLFVPPEDAELVGPQIAFYGVDDIEDIRIYAGSGWSTQGVLQGVPVRHTDGVRTVAPHLGEGYGPAWSTFVAAYETHFQRTLRSPVPGLGWDAARLVLEAAALGGGTPEGVARGLREIRSLEGATGTFSWRDGRIGRAYTPVVIRNRTLVPHPEEP